MSREKGEKRISTVVKALLKRDPEGSRVHVGSHKQQGLGCVQCVVWTELAGVLGWLDGNRLTQNAIL